MTVATDFLKAVEKGNIPQINALLADNKELIHAKNAWNSTALYIATDIACQNGNTAIVDLLISHGADVNTPNAMKLTPLHIAAEFDKTSVIVEKLLKAGATASVNSQNTYGNTPLHRAAANGIAGNVNLLLQHQANVYIPNSLEKKACDFAIVSEALVALQALSNPTNAIVTQSQLPAPSSLDNNASSVMIASNTDKDNLNAGVRSVNS